MQIYTVCRLKIDVFGFLDGFIYVNLWLGSRNASAPRRNKGVLAEDLQEEVDGGLCLNGGWCYVVNVCANNVLIR